MNIFEEVGNQKIDFIEFEEFVLFFFSYLNSIYPPEK